MIPHQCSVCQGELEKRPGTFTSWIDDRLVVIENVPALVCKQCGETYYEPDIVERIQKLVWSGVKPTRTVETPVYDLNAA